MADRLLPLDAALERLKGLHPRSIDLSLARMERLCEALGHPERSLPPVLHVAGTNGKGSTVAFLRAFAEAAGLKAHVYTSPHLVRFAERIRVAGALIGDVALAEAVGRVESANAGAPITFFEVATAAAFTAFSETSADVCIVEVGLGGRLDATNVIAAPAVSVIAPVDLDHREFLGETVEAVAAEKAGILKRGRPGVVGRQRSNSLEVISARADRVGALLTIMGADFDAFREGGRLVFQGEDRLMDLPEPALVGAHQFDNAGLAIAAVLKLGDRRIDEAAIARGLTSVEWPGRLQRLKIGPLAAEALRAGADLILDGGHNPHAAKALARAIEDLAARDPRPLVLIAGMMANKDALAFFTALRRINPEIIFTVPVGAEAATDPRTLAQSVRMVGLKAETATDVQSALARALEACDAPRVVICGSLYLAGEVLAMSEETWPR